MKTKIPLILIALFSFVYGSQRGCSQSQIITVDSIIQTSPCAGSNIYIAYTVSGGDFNWGNVFTAQLSGPSGSFSNPTSIGSILYWSNGLIVGTIPITATFSINYKVRIVASFPAYTSSPAPNNVIVTNIAQLATITVSPSNGTICSGDSATLIAITPAQAYVWSTGATTQSIHVSQSGNYTVTVTDMLGCETVSQPETITVQECVSVQNISFPTMLTIYPNPCVNAVIVKYSLVSGTPVKINITDMIGKKVAVVVDETQVSGAHQKAISIEGLQLSPGIYFLNLQTTDFKETHKIIVAN